MVFTSERSPHPGPPLKRGREDDLHALSDLGDGWDVGWDSAEQTVQKLIV
jgi:hypothetical protein